MTDQQLRALARPMDRLERRTRISHVAGLVILIGLVLVGLLGAAARDPGIGSDALRVHQVVVLDAAGRERAMISTRDDGTPVLALRDEQGTVRVALTVGKDGSPAVRVYDARERVRARLGLGPDQAGTLMLVDEEGKATWRAP